MKVTQFFAIAALVFGGATAARAQDSMSTQGYAGAPSHVVQHGTDSNGYFAGTIEGSGLNGMGNFARGVGQFNYYTAMAAREMQEARGLAIMNHQTAVSNWWRNRDAYQERQRAEQLTPEQVARVVEMSTPQRLTAAQYQPLSGELSWPVALKSPEFDEERAAIDEAFANRTSRDAGGDSAFYAEIDQNVEVMLEKLRDKLPELSPSQYIAGKKFLVGVKYEALSPTNINSLAMAD